MNLLLSFSKVVIPCMMAVFACVFISSDSNKYDSFVKGAKEGINNCMNLLPTLLLVMCGVGAFYSSGAIDILCMTLRPVFAVLGVPQEMLPSIILRPFSGSAVNSVADRLFRETGADSSVSKTVCLFVGTTDTIIYTLSAYFSSSGIKRTRYAIPASFVVFIFSIILCNAVGNIVL